MPKSNANLALKGLDEMFSTEESRQEQKREQVQQIPIEELFPFKEHPFKVLDEAMLHRLISRIVVGEMKKVDGQKQQEVKIIYNFVGEIPE